MAIDPVTGIAGAVGEGFSFLSLVADILTDPAKFKTWERDKKLEVYAKGYHAAVEAGDGAAMDAYLKLYRELSASINP